MGHYSLLSTLQPPTVLFRHTDGPIAQSTTGELIVFPGTTLHMECLFLKRAGTPVQIFSVICQIFSFYLKIFPGVDHAARHQGELPAGLGAGAHEGLHAGVQAQHSQGKHIFYYKKYFKIFN